MNKIDLLSFIVKNMLKRKLRTFFTVSGVVIGSCAIIVLISIGIAFRYNFEKQLEHMTDITIIEVYPKDGEQGISESTFLEFSALNGVHSITPVLEEHVEAKSGKYEGYINIKGIDTSVLEDFGVELEKGRFLDEGDKNGMIFGADIGYSFQKPRSGGRYRGRYDENGNIIPPNVDVMEDKINLLLYNSDKKYKVDAVGLTKEGNYRTSYSAFASMEYVEKIRKDRKKLEAEYNNTRRSKDSDYNNVWIKAKDVEDVKTISAYLKKEGYWFNSPLEYTESINKMANGVQMFLGVICGVLLFTVATGITNTMVMSVYERSKEFAVFKVIAVIVKYVKMMFLRKTSFTGPLSRSFGVLFSLIISYFGNEYASTIIPGMGESNISIIPLWLIVLSLLFLYL